MELLAQHQNLMKAMRFCNNYLILWNLYMQQMAHETLEGSEMGITYRPNRCHHVPTGVSNLKYPPPTSTG